MPNMLPPTLLPVSLADRYEQDDGAVYLSGIQALVRLLFDQRDVDSLAGLNTGTFVSGYQGSPLGTFDTELKRNNRRASERGIVHSPGVNEELAATAVWGTQLLHNMPGRQRDGVLGVWYGKSPGVDRASDAIRHGNLVGTAPNGGVLALTGDDPAAKSSTMPGASEATLAALSVPVLHPGSVQEALDLGRHAIACSRASGLWSSLKVVTRVCDATAVASVGLGRVTPIMPDADWPGGTASHLPHSHLIGPRLLELERSMLEVRLERAREYGRRNGLAVITHDAPDARLGFVVSGPAYYDLLQVFADLGVPDPPVRILKLGMIYPLDEVAIRAFASRLEEIVVIEEKGPFLERLIKDALYGTSGSPRITGKLDEAGRRLIPSGGSLDADALARPVAARLSRFHEFEAVEARLGELDALAARSLPTIPQRAPFFCSGCPHSSSTATDAGTVVGAGIGCHTLVLLHPQGRGDLTGTTQMGGEGAQWIGLTPFMEPTHIVQNMGDGTFHHSGSLAIRAAVAAKLTVTYKLLYNDAVAMTGGQSVVGKLSVPDIARLLLAEGVAKVTITAEDVSRYDGLSLPAGVQVRPREDLLAVQRELSGLPGVSVLIHDQLCAIEKRRARKRGDIVTPRQQVVINERVCEGCGDCGAKSNCLSVEPVDTEFGRKTRIHQSSCTKDFSCLKGDCPSFLTVVPPAKPGKLAVRLPAVTLPPPAKPARRRGRIRMVGVGGTGVVTVSQILSVAAMLDGLHATGLDQTGLSQKGGPVVSDIHIGDTPEMGSVSASDGGIDLLLVLDILGGAAPANLVKASGERTLAAINTTLSPTSEMATHVDAPTPDLAAARAAIDACTRAEETVACEARDLAQTLFGDHMATNVIMLGVAWQQGGLPVTLEAIQEAVRLNGVAVEQNLAALAWGRAAVVAPDSVAELLRKPSNRPRVTTSAERSLIDSVTTEPGALRDLLEIRIPDLVGYQDIAYAREYAGIVADAKAAEDRLAYVAGGKLAESVARNLYKLMAYKDEYEVARLHLEALAELPAGSRAAVHLHPPTLREHGLNHKLAIRQEIAIPSFRALRRLRRLRGTPFDPFGRATVRRVERALVGEYQDYVRVALDAVTAANYGRVLELLETPDIVRGYEHIKLDNVARFRSRADQLRAELTGAPIK